MSPAPAEAARSRLLLSAPQSRLLFSFSLLAMLLRVPRLIAGDTWFNLVLGRDIVAHGLIHQNTLTEQGFRAHVVDLQWLAHWLIYRLHCLVGVPGLALVAALLGAGALLMVAGFALLQRRASPARVMLLGSIALVTVTRQTVARAQSLALPLLSALLWLLAEDARRPTRRVWWVVPLAALWGNLHGSAMLVPALTSLLVASRVLSTWRERRALDLRGLGRDLLVLLSASLALLVSPYGHELIGYYGSTFGNPAFRLYVSEWHAPSLSASWEAVLALVWVGCLLPFAPRRAPWFELMTCLALFGLTMTSARHATPLVLAALAYLPSVADAALADRLRFVTDRSIDLAARVLPPCALAAFVVGVPWLAWHTQRVDFPVAFTDHVAEAAGSDRHLLVDEAHADRLLWSRPQLSGRVSHDARIETMPLGFLRSLAQAYAAPQDPAARRWLASYDLIIVDHNGHAALARALSQSADFRLLAEDRFASLYANVRVNRSAALPSCRSDTRATR